MARCGVVHVVGEEQRVRIGGRAFDFSRDEYIITEHSHKYSLERFAAMAAEAGFDQEECWTDAADLFSVQYLTAA